MPVYSRSGYDITPLTQERLQPLLAELSEEAIRITQKAGTEQPFCGTLLDNKKEGFYACVVCGLPLFSSSHKYTSGTGWPSFFSPFAPEHVGTKADKTFDFKRVEITCTRCDSHLGHVFDDGPKPTGKRYCLNSASLHFYKEGDSRQARRVAEEQLEGIKIHLAEREQAFLTERTFLLEQRNDT